MTADTIPAARAGSNPRASLSPKERLETQATITLGDFSALIGWDRSTVLKKERAGIIPKRRNLAGVPLFLTAEVKAWMEGANPIGAKPDHSDRARRAKNIIKAREVKAAKAKGGAA